MIQVLEVQLLALGRLHQPSGKLLHGIEARVFDKVGNRRAENRGGSEKAGVLSVEDILDDLGDAFNELFQHSR